MANSPNSSSNNSNQQLDIVHVGGVTVTNTNPTSPNEALPMGQLGLNQKVNKLRKITPLKPKGVHLSPVTLRNPSISSEPSNLPQNATTQIVVDGATVNMRAHGIYLRSHLISAESTRERLTSIYNDRIGHGTEAILKASETLRAQLVNHASSSSSSLPRERLATVNGVAAAAENMKARGKLLRAQLLYAAASTRERLANPSFQTITFPMQNQYSHTASFNFGNPNNSLVCSTIQNYHQSQTQPIPATRVTIIDVDDEPAASPITNAPPESNGIFFNPKPLKVYVPNNRTCSTDIPSQNLKGQKIMNESQKSRSKQQLTLVPDIPNHHQVDTVVGDYVVDYDGEGYDGRIHSVPYQKYGPYTCPVCLGVFSTSQQFAAHAGAHYANETSEQRRKRLLAKCKHKNELHLQETSCGLTFVPVASNSSSNSNFNKEGDRDGDGDGNASASNEVGAAAQGRKRHAPAAMKVEVEEQGEGGDAEEPPSKKSYSNGGDASTGVKIKVEPSA